MENLIHRHRNATALVTVLFLQILALAIQIKRPAEPGNPEAGSIRLIRLWVVTALTPFERGFVNVAGLSRTLWSDYLDLRGVRQENRALREEMERMRIERAQMSEAASQGHRLQALLGFKQQFISQTLAAQVLGSSGSDRSRILYLDKGSSDGVKEDMAVITPEGVVGKVLRVFPNSAQVLAINDPTSGAGAVLEKSRLQGVVTGTDAGELRLRYVMVDEKVEVGERVLTSGGDRIYPKGLPVGTVAGVKPGSDLFFDIRVEPAARLNRLEEVLIVTHIAEQTPQTEAAEAPPRRAAEILSQRLPGLPPKTADASAAGAQPPSSGPPPETPPKAPR
jgi:rod shape-determining protein MreC